MIQLYNGDCLVEMQKIPSGSIDAIITDPPYGTTACKWDSVIPFDLMWEQLNRIIKPNGAIVLFGSEPFSSALRMSNIKNYKYDFVWSKGYGRDPFATNKRPMKSHELISIFYKKQPVFNPQKTEGKPYTDKRKNQKIISDHYIKDRIGIINTGTREPISVLNITPSNSNSLHPTQKPVLLMEYLIKTYTNEGETVLDFTMGSGTTMIACQKTNRNGIGIESDEVYFNTAKKRIKDTKNDTII